MKDLVDIKMFKLIPVLLVFELRLSRCSLVIDSLSQQSISISDYCPSFHFCKEGAHVMCMYYNPDHVLGPHCSNGVNISFNEELATTVLEVVNAFRSKIANGKETGKENKKLPRAYGMFRLQWDNELATFAQVLANQCILQHDLCRSTRRFPSPGQTLALKMFLYPDWRIIGSNDEDFTGLSEDKKMHTVTSALKNWYLTKTDVTEYMAMVHPDFNLIPKHEAKGRPYLELIHGATTHIGCGFCGFSQYVPLDYKNNSGFNSIFTVCNYSAKPQIGRSVYNMDPPAPGQGYSPKCGCPPGSEEDEDCLCNLLPRKAERKVKCNSLDGKGCDPTLVLLPIFTVEDAPPDKLFEHADSIRDPLRDFIFESTDNSSVSQRMRQYQTMFDSFNPKPKARQSILRNIPTISHAARVAGKRKTSQRSNVIHRVQEVSPAFPPMEDPPLPPPRIPPPPPPLRPPPPPPSRPARTHHRTRAPPPIPPRKPSHARTSPKRNYSPARRAHVDHQSTDVLHSHDTFDSPRILLRQSRKPKKSSIFTKVAQFKLPAKKDVSPRKDYSNLHKEFDKYLKRLQYANRRNDVHSEVITPDLERLHTEVHADEITTEIILKTAEEKLINFNQYLKENKYNMDNHSLDMVLKDENDKNNKLLSLLNTLEKEVKRNALDGDEKELIDAKIRKIYGSIVGTTERTLLSSTTTNGYDSDIAEIDIGNSKNSGKYELVNFTDGEKHPKNYDYLVDSRNRKLNSDLLHKRYNNNLDENGFSDSEGKHDIYNYNKYNYNYGHKYGMKDFANKYNKNHDHNKYSENNVDSKFGIRHKYTQNDPKYHHNYDWIHKYDETVPVHKNTLKYEGKDFNEFRELKHSLTSMEDDAIKYSNLLEFRNRELAKHIHDRQDRDGRRIGEPGNPRNKIERKSNTMYNYQDDIIDDPLSLERRKYFQEKLDNIERMLLSRSSDHGGNRVRRMKPASPRTGSKSDNYVPHRARILHSVMYEFY
ncbi:uncharacterized protein LOC118270825 [Spodoptera frugiperda]|uniref:Uncharacterized protein LOC118270825 n=1 Tax=Spodoptera frugiperda TaxID=7108 RepID=A0A9R0D6S8_SPOFR|nr:uncharacterized protein LOC118270825 [Spodoptera frugiperda]